VRLRRGLPVLVLVAALAAAPGGAQQLGLVAVRNQLPFDQLFLALTPEGATTLPDGGLGLELSASWSNTFIMSPEIHDWVRAERAPGRRGLTPDELARLVELYSDRDLYFFDGEILRWSLRARYGITDTLELAVELSAQSRGGGFADGTIESFHGSLGLGNADRERFPQNNFQVFMRFGDHTFFRDGAPANNVIGDTTVQLKWRAHRPWHGWLGAVSAAVKAPTGSQEHFGGSGGWDGQLAAYASRDLGPGALHVNLAYTALGGVENLPGFSVDDLWTLVAGYELWSPRHRVNWIAQATWATSVFRDSTRSDLSDPAYLLLVGARVPLGERTTLTAAFIENVVQFDNSTDVALHLSVGYRVR